MKVSHIDNTKFCGIPISTVKVKNNNSVYKLYDIKTEADLDFLKKMPNILDFRKLMPGLREIDYIIWERLFGSAVESAKNTTNSVYIETCDNVPCGLMNYFHRNNIYHINYVVTFPDKPGHRVPCGGQILFNELYKRFLSSNANKVELQALKDSPFDPISKYLKMGFKMLGGDNYSEAMRINRVNAVETFRKQNEYIFSEPLKNQKDVDLEKTLNFNSIA